MKLMTLFISCLVIFFIPSLQAQVCQRDKTPQSVAASNFDLNYNNSGGALIQDRISGLIWQRCVYGQSWDGQTCSGLPQKLTWQEALINGGSEWRVPDIKELSSILDWQCVTPPLHPTIFPNMPGSTANGLWTSTPYVTPSSTQTNAWWVDLNFGFMDYRSVVTTNFVLYVRSP